MIGVNVILHGATAMLNIGETAGLARSAGALRPYIPDGMPLIGRAGGHDDVWLALRADRC
ncbi:MAG TPA: hypothetical protein VFV51_08020 [Vicinamibacterales bacterium]|nr:hypothetical protein [Vicinamibacterales bacterium]